MRRIIISLVAAAALTLALVGSAMAQDICASGQAFAQEHILVVVVGDVGGQPAHIPGTHQGFFGLCEVPANP